MEVKLQHVDRRIDVSRKALGFMITRSRGCWGCVRVEGGGVWINTCSSHSSVVYVHQTNTFLTSSTSHVGLLCRQPQDNSPGNNWPKLFPLQMMFSLIIWRDVHRILCQYINPTVFFFPINCFTIIMKKVKLLNSILSIVN